MEASAVRKKIIVDCDAGVDDGLALTMLIAAHKAGKVEILGITCVGGNTNVDNVVKNVFRTLHVCNAANDIPVYKGQANEFPGQGSHGADGFGHVYTDAPDISKLKKEPAVSALNTITSQHYGSVTILCLAPLSNIALAIETYPSFVNSVDKFLVMGGTIGEIGSAIPRVDFNFHADPESAQALLSTAPSRVWLIPLDTCLKSTVTYEWRETVFAKLETPVVKLIADIERKTYEEKKKYRPHYSPCDAFVAGILLRPDMAKDVTAHRVEIQMNDPKKKGKIIIESGPPNAHIVHDVNSEIFKQLLLFAADPNLESCHVLL